MSVIQMDAQAAIQAIATKPLSPIYLVSGSEHYLHDQIRQAFLKRLSISETSDLNFLSLDMEEASISSLLDEAETMPFFGDNRLIFVENPYFLTSEKKQTDIENDIASLIQYVQQPLESTILVLFAAYEKLDERKKIVKQVKKNSTVIQAAPLSEQEARRFIQQTLDNEGVRMDRGAVELFIQLTDLDLTKMMSELKKLLLFLGDERTISSEVVTSLIPKTLEHNIFDMTNHVLSGNVDAAMRLYDDLHLQGEETIKISAILLTQVRLLLQCKLLIDIGYQQANIAETLGIHPYRIKLAMQQGRKFQTKTLMTLFDRLVENDYLTKTGQMDKELLFQLFVLQTASVTR